LRSVRVKICGLTRKKDLTATVDSGADAIGFIVGVPSSPRNLTLEKAEMLLSQVPVFVDSIVVTTPKSMSWLIEIYERLKPSAIQIHGKEQFDSLEIRKEIKNTRLIKTVYVTESAFNEKTIEDLKTFDAILLDSFSKGQYGGTGKVHDWMLSRKIKEAVMPVPVILAGGLKPENVKEAILTVEPYAVDVSSGVEASVGVKDLRKVRAFVENVKQIKVNDKDVLM
jgi:phosphoribosylanthranilate isomerase